MPDIVYSAASGRVRRIIVPSGGPALAGGEALLTVSQATYLGFADLNAVQAFVTSSTGKTPANDRYVAVDASNNVLSVHIADPACGDVAPRAGASLVAHATANPGDLLWNGKLIPNTPVTRLPPNTQTSRLRPHARNSPLP